MRMRLAVLSAALAAALAPRTSGPSDRMPCEGFLPPNDLKILADDPRTGGIAEEVFDRVLDRAETLFRPIVAARGGKLVVVRKWPDPKVNAVAEQNGGTWHITMYGGLARHPAVTEEGFALVACHELGHHLGGFPKKLVGGWPTNEGGADYYATLKCLRRLLPDAAPGKTDPVAAAACDAAWREGPDRNHCKSGAMAGVSIAALLQALRPGAPMPDLAKPDPEVVDRTYDRHPAPQCRLDTYFQGALCAKPWAEELSDGDPSPGACAEAGGFDKGLRPRCWYKPPAPRRSAPVLPRAPLASEKALAERWSALRAAFDERGF